MLLGSLGVFENEARSPLVGARPLADLALAPEYQDQQSGDAQEQVSASTQRGQCAR